jgi:hypothetical protein
VPTKWTLSEHGVPITVTQPGDPAYALLLDDYRSTTTAEHDPRCFICEDPEFAQMGLPLCRPCPRCQTSGRPGHVPADDCECTVCGYVEEAEDPVRDHNGERGELR